MKTSKTRVALAVTMLISLYGFPNVEAAWWDGGEYNSTQVGNGITETITGDLTIKTEDVTALWLANNANITANNGINVKIEVTDTSTTKYGIYNDTSTLDLRNAESVNIINDSESGNGVAAINGGRIDFGDNVVIQQTNKNTDDNITGAYAVAAHSGSIITFGNHNTFFTGALGSAALYTVGSGSAISVGNYNKLTTFGINSHGVRAVTNASITLGDYNVITTHGKGSPGLYTQGSSSMTMGDNNIVTTYGHGSYVTPSGTVRPSGITVTESGRAEIGSGNVIIAYGEEAYGLDVDRNGSIKVKDGNSITVWGKDAMAVFANSSSTVTFEGKQTIYSAQSYALWAGNGNSSITADGELTVHGDIGVLTATDGIDLNFLDGSYFKGATNSKSGGVTPENYDGTLDMNMIGSRWDMTGDSHVTNLTGDNSHIYFNYNALPSTHLTLASLASGNADGGATFYMNSHVESGDVINGGSGDDITDKLIVTGTDAANGSHNVRVADRGGALTKGGETITIIETEGGDAEFTMGKYSEQGAYLYSLRRVDGSPNNWELYGLKVIADTPKAVVDSVSATYMVFYLENQTLLQRLGDLRHSPDEYGAWVKFHGGDIRGKTTAYTNGYDLDFAGVQLGIDHRPQTDWLNGDLYLGLWGGYTKVDVDYYSSHSGDIKQYFVGLYGTYIDEKNTYADLVLKYGRQKNEIDGFSTQGTPVSGDDRSSMYGASLEVGKRIHFKKLSERDEGFYIEPQAQFSFTHLGSTDMKLSSGLRVNSGGLDSVIGRVGANVGLERKYNDTPFNVYAKVSYQKEFDGDATVRFNGDDPSRIELKDDWWTYGMGVTAKVADKHNIYLDVERSSASDLFSRSTRVNVGYRYTF